MHVYSHMREKVSRGTAEVWESWRWKIAAWKSTMGESAPLVVWGNKVANTMAADGASLPDPPEFAAVCTEGCHLYH